MKRQILQLLVGIFIVTTTHGFGIPFISEEPVDLTVNQGFDATLSVSARGYPPFTVQWFFTTNQIAVFMTNALRITSTLTLAKAQRTNAGSYFAIIKDGAGVTATSRVAMVTVTLPAILDPRIGANIRVGEDSPLLPGRNQGEIHVARSFTDPNILVAGFQDGIGSAENGAPACGYATSADGGLTWYRSLVPGLTKAAGGADDFSANNVAAVDSQGNLYIASLSGPLTPVPYVRQLIITKSVDGGQSFGVPLVAAKGAVSDSTDKEWIAINTFPGTPHPNRIAAAYTRGDFNLRSYSIYSDDDAKTWSPPAFLGPRTVGVQNRFLPDGSLAVLYWKFVTESYGDGRQQMEIVRSKDGGAVFDPPVVVMNADNFLNPDPNIFTSRFFPSVCTDRQAGVIYVAVATKNGAPTNQSSRVLFTRSIDQGKTWGVPLQVNDNPPGKTLGLPVIAASPDGQHVLIQFYDKRNDPGEDFFVDLYLAESFDGGATWEPNLRLSEFSSDIRKAPLQFGFDPQHFLGDYEGLVPSLNFETPAVAAWIDTRAGNSDPYVVQIRRTKGTTFETWRKLRFSTTELTDAGISGPNADPDGDGISNLSEYAFGLEPNHKDTNPLRSMVGKSNGEPRLELFREHLAVADDVAASWEASDDLVHWTPTRPDEETSLEGRNPWMKAFKDSFGANNKKKFFRLRLSLISLAPPVSW